MPSEERRGARMNCSARASAEPQGIKNVFGTGSLPFLWFALAKEQRERPGLCLNSSLGSGNRV